MPRQLATLSLIAMAILPSCGEQGRTVADSGTEVAIVPDVVYGHKAGMALTFDIYRPPRPNGLGVLYLVSNVWYSRWSPPEESLDQFVELLERGFTVFRVRHGSSPYFKIQPIFADVQRAVRSIRRSAAEYGVDPNRLGVYGGSAGGHLAMLLATSSDDGDPDAEDEVDRVSNRVAAVVAFHPPVDVRAEVKRRADARRDAPDQTRAGPALEIDVEEAPTYSPWLHVSADDPPTLIVHGDRDELVPLESSRLMLDKLREHGVPAELIVLEGAGHLFDDDQWKRAREAMAEWFARYLAGE